MLQRTVLLTTVAILVNCDGPLTTESSFTATGLELQTVANSFIFPVKGKSVSKIEENTRDPRKDGWYVSNDFGNFCLAKDCNGNEGYHPGEDWNMKCEKAGDVSCDRGEPVYAAADGLVTLARQYVSEAALKECNYKCDLGIAVVILHDLPKEEDVSAYVLPGTTISERQRIVKQIETGYLHLETLAVQKDQRVKKGDLLGTIGNFGGPHLHFEVRWKTGNPLFADYKATHQILTDRGLLVPTTFVSAHTAPPPFVFAAKEGENPVICTAEPEKDPVTGKLLCNRVTQAPQNATLWSALSLEKIRKYTCVGATVFKDNVYRTSIAPACVTADDLNVRDTTIFWTRSTFNDTGNWRIEHKAGANQYDLQTIDSSTFTIAPDTSPPPPIPPAPIYHNYYTYTGVKLTCDRTLSKEWWSEYRCDGIRSPIPFGKDIYTMVKLHYLAPNVRYRFSHELYRDGAYQSTLTDPAWLTSGPYGQSEVYAFPSINAGTIGRTPEKGTWTIRTFIAIEGKFTNWVTDQSVTIF